MTNRKTFQILPGLAVATFVLAAAATNEGCSSVPGGGSCDSSVSANVKAFTQASADLTVVAGTMEDAVLTACSNMDRDLGVTDTWSSMSTKDLKVSEACDQANKKIKAIFAAQADANAACTLAVSGGGCTVNVDAEASCDATCQGGASCTPPSVTASCDPGQLSVQCMGMCQANATCEGTLMVAANCQGTCDADCSGSCTPPTAGKIHCEGTCMGNCSGTCDGKATPAGAGAACTGMCSGQCDAQCQYSAGKPGHCEGSCTGTCTGNCKLDANANIDCGVNVSCKGGCMGTATAPKCEGEVTPPMCNADVNCKASCQGHAEATAMCTPPTATLECSATASASSDIQKLTATVGANLGVIVEAVKTQGPLAIKAAGHIATTGAAVAQSATCLGLQTIADVTASASAAATATVSVNVSVMASASVSGSCGGPSS